MGNGVLSSAYVLPLRQVVTPDLDGGWRLDVQRLRSVGIITRTCRDQEGGSLIK